MIEQVLVGDGLAGGELDQLAVDADGDVVEGGATLAAAAEEGADGRRRVGGPAPGGDAGAGVLDVAFAAIARRDAVAAETVADAVGRFQLAKHAADLDEGDEGVAVDAGVPFAFDGQVSAAGELVSDRRRGRAALLRVVEF